MATPRSVLRSAVKSRSKSAAGFLQPAPSTIKRKVVFNEDVYVQEIIDIRDKALHWTASDDEAVEPVSRAPAPAPAVHDASRADSDTRLSALTCITQPLFTPTRSDRQPAIRTPVSISASLPSFTPPTLAFRPDESCSVTLPMSSTPTRSTQATPISGRRAGRVVAHGTPSSTKATPGSTKRRAGRVSSAQPLNASVVARRAVDVSVAGGASQVQRLTSDALQIQRLAATPASLLPPGSISQTAVRPSTTKTLFQRMEAIRRQSLPASRVPSHTDVLSSAKRPMLSSTVSETPTQASLHSPDAIETTANQTPGQYSHIETMDVEMTSQDDRPVAASGGMPARQLASRASAMTPNLAAGLRRLFRTSLPQETPRFAGLRDLFQLPSSRTNSPSLEGVAALLESHGPTSESPRCASPSPTAHQPSPAPSLPPSTAYSQHAEGETILTAFAQEASAIERQSLPEHINTALAALTISSDETRTVSGNLEPATFDSTEEACAQVGGRLGAGDVEDGLAPDDEAAPPAYTTHNVAVSPRSKTCESGAASKTEEDDQDVGFTEAETLAIETEVKPKRGRATRIAVKAGKSSAFQVVKKSQR